MTAPTDLPRFLTENFTERIADLEALIKKQPTHSDRKEK